MSKVKFIVPATYAQHNGHDKDGKEIIVKVPYENAGQEVEVPEADADHFDKLGWQREGKKGK